MPFSRFLAAAAVATCCFLPANANEPSFSADQKTEIEAIVRDYLINNPGILEEMFTALEAERAVETAEQMNKALEDNAALIFDASKAQIMGNPEGTVKLVEYFDYNCGVCRSEYSVVRELIKANPELKVVLWEWPVVRPPESIDAARVSLAVRELGGLEKWNEFHTKVMESGVLADKGSTLKIAEEMGFSAKEIEAKFDSDFARAHFQNSGVSGDAMQFRGTPTFIVGDTIIAGGGRIDELQALIDAEKAKPEAERR